MELLTEDKKLQVKQLKDWINEQPLFPKNIEENLVVRFLHSSYYDMIKSKKTAELFFIVRASLSEILTNRDLMEPSMQKCMKHVNIACYQTSEKRNIFIWQLNDPGLVNYDYVQHSKFFLLASDASLIENEDLPEEDVFIFDMKDMTMKFLWAIKFSLAKKCAKFLESAIPYRIKEAHMMNAPYIVDKVVSLFRPFLRKDFQIHFHRANSMTIFDHFRKDDLPVDYGGTRPPMEELMKDMVGILEKNRKRLSQDMLWAIEK